MIRKSFFALSLILLSSLLNAQTSVTLDETFSIDQAIELALNHNPDLMEQKAALMRASGILKQAKGNFDVKVGVEASYNETYTPMDKNNPQAKSGDEILYQTVYGQELTGKAYIEKLFAFGINTRINYQLQRTKNEYKDGIYELDPYYASYGHPNYNNTGAVSLEISIPLLKGFTNAIADNNLKLARKNYESMQKNMEDAMSKVIMQTSENYWKLLVASEKVNTLEKILETNKTRLANVEKLVNAGVRTKNDLLRLKVNLIDNQRQLESARIEYGTARINLAMQIGVPVEKIAKPAIELPEIDLDSNFPVVADFTNEKLDQIALSRPDLMALSNNVESASIKVKNARTNRMPDLDVKFNIGSNGALYGWDAENYFQAANHNVRKMNYGGAVTFSMPLQNNTKRGELLQAEADLMEAEAKLNRQKSIFILQLTNAVNALNAYRETVKNAGNVLELQKQVYENEQKRYDAGLSNVDNLIQQDSSWLEANINYYQIFETYLKYVMEYKYYTSGLVQMTGDAQTLYNLKTETEETEGDGKNE